MPPRVQTQARGYISPLILADFSGGWNPRDAPSEIGDNESPNCLNVTLDERGGVVKRLGLEQVGGGGLTGQIKNMFFWKTGEVTLVQDGNVLKKTSNFTAYTVVQTFTTPERCAMCDFNGKLIFVHPTDKVCTYDGTTCVPVVTSPRGSTIAVWQNKVWVAGDPTAPSRVYACKPNDPTTWDMTGTGDIIEIREKDGLPVTALGAGQGMDISGRPGLLVFKQDSTHRINDSRSGTTFGSYTTLHNRAGAGGSLCVRSTQSGLVASINHRGIFVCDGVNPPILASEKLEPFFTDLELNLAQVNNWVSGMHDDRVVFSITRGPGQTSNNYTLEFSPSQGWIVPHSFGCSAFTEDLTAGVRRLRGSHRSSPKIYEVFRSGADDGVEISSRWQSRWFEPAAGYMIRMRRLIVAGRGDFSLNTKGDYTLGEGVLSHFVSGGLGGTWGTEDWGSGVWGGTFYETYQPFYSLGVARSVSFELRETSSISVNKPPMNEDGSAHEVGNFALYGLKLDHIRLGYT